MKVVVYLPIKVPNNKYCWNHINLCEHLSTDSINPTCDLHMGYPTYDKEDKILKPIKCKELLKEVL